MRNIFYLAFAHLFVMGAWGQNSYVPTTRVLQDKGYQLILSGDVFQTSSVINPDGTRQDLADEQSFTRYQLEAGGQYGLTKELQLGLGGRLRHQESTFIDGTGDTVNATGSGLQSIFTTFHYAFTPVGSLAYTLEGLYRYTPYTKNIYSPGSSQTKLILGDDGNEYSVGLGVTYTLPKNNFITVRSGYRKPGADLSDEIYWQAEGAMAWKQVALILGVDGISSLNNDPFSDVARPVYNTGTTGLYNSSNREWIAPYVGFNIALGEQWRVEMRGSQVVDGQSTDLGRSYGLQIIRRIEKPIKTVDSRFKSYDLEATVTKVSAKKNYVVIDKGLAEDFQKGMSVDFFEFDYVGGNVLVARGTVISTKADSSVVKITQRFNQKKEIKEGLIGRASLR